MAPKPAPDFKRIKAKVGKRAPKPATSTETEFRTASLHVRRQQQRQVQLLRGASSREEEEAGGGAETPRLVSSRGRSLPELRHQLRHPAAQVRLSACRGLLDVVRQQSAAVRWHLHSLVPACADTCTDDDGDVRGAGLACLREVLSSLDDGTGAAAANRLAPPLAGLLVAHASAALNHLDVATRRHGAAVLLTAVAGAPPAGRAAAAKAPTLLPALARLLSDRSAASCSVGSQNQYGGGSPNRKKGGSRKRKRTSQVTSGSGSQHGVLEAVVALLRAVVKSRGLREEYVLSPESFLESQPTMRFVPGGTSTNALLLVGRPQTNSFRREEPRAGDASSINRLSSKIIADVLSSLRNVWMETAQKHGQHLSAHPDLSAVFLPTVKALRLFLDGFAVDIRRATQSEQSSSKASGRSLEKLATQIANLILECLPLTGPVATAVEETNAELCVLLMRLVVVVDREDDKKDWVAVVADYVQTRLELETETDTASSSASSESLLRVLGQLLLSDMVQNARLLSGLTETFRSAFFHERVPAEHARSHLGRLAVLLAHAMMEKCCYDVEKAVAVYGSAMHAVLTHVPAYLKYWRADVPSNSAACMTLMLHVARRYPESSPFLAPFRSVLEMSILAPEKSGSSVFEHYPSELQRQTICLLVMSEGLTTGSLKALGTICARCRLRLDSDIIDPEVASFVVHSIHDIRKTLPMQAYVTFLTESTGLTRLSEAESLEPFNEKAWVSIDLVLRDISFCLVDCEPARVLPMLEPLLRFWLNKTSDSLVGRALSARDAIVSRASLVILAILSSDLTDGGSIVEVSVLDFISNDASEQMIVSIARLLFYSVMELQKENTVKDWVRPLIALFSSEPTMMGRVFDSLCSKLDQVDGPSQANLLELWCSIMKDSQIVGVLEHDNGSMLATAKKAGSALKEGPVAKVLGRIATELELKVGDRE